MKPVRASTLDEADPPSWLNPPADALGSNPILTSTSAFTATPRRPQGRNSRNKRSPYLAALLFAGLLIACVAGVAALAWKGIPTAGLESVVQSASGVLTHLPGADSHQSVIDDYQAFVAGGNQLAPLHNIQEVLRERRGKPKHATEAMNHGKFVLR